MLTLWAALQAWGYRFTEYYNDGINYLDIAEHFAQGDFSAGFSCYWSPLYSAVLAVFLKLSPARGLSEFALLKGVNFLIYLFFFFVFERFLNRFINFYQRSFPNTEISYVAISNKQWQMLGYSSFAYGAFVLGGTWIDSPDILMAALFLAALSIALDLPNYSEKKRKFAMCWIGALMGLGYLAKAVLFGVSLSFLAGMALARKQLKLRKHDFLLTILTLAIVSAPYIAFISKQTGEFTLSPVGKLNAIWFVTRDLSIYQGRGSKAAEASLIHPSRLICAQPATYEFAEPIKGTYPLSFDPTYWMSGAKLSMSIVKVLPVIILNAMYFFQLFFGYALAAFVILMVIAGYRITDWQAIKLNAMFILPVFLTISGYSLSCNLAISPTHTRHFTLALLLTIIGSFSCLRLAKSSQLPPSATNRATAKVKTGLQLVITITCLLCITLCIARLCNDWQYATTSPDLAHLRVAQGLARLGLKEGNAVALMSTQEPLIDWAKIDGLRIIANISSSSEFWQASAHQRATALAAIKNTGAKAIIYFPRAVSQYGRLVTTYRDHDYLNYLKLLGAHGPQLYSKPDPGPFESGWQKLEGVDCYVYLF
jgi:hypothetical protein